MDVKTNHKHVWERWYTRGVKIVGLHCKCGEQNERETTPKERKELIAEMKHQKEESNEMHAVAWDFQKKFLFDKKWKYVGWDLMERVEKWAKKYPKDVSICRIDDAYNASSSLVFVLHRVGRRLWGTTCYTITQCDGQPPHEWFMYPSHRLGIQKAMKMMSGLKDFSA